MNIKKYSLFIALLPLISHTMHQTEPPLFIIRGQPVTQQNAEDFIWQTGIRALEWEATSFCCYGAIQAPLALTNLTLFRSSAHFSNELLAGICATSVIGGCGTGAYCAKQLCTIRPGHETEDKAAIATALICPGPAQCACCLLGAKKLFDRFNSHPKSH